MFKFICIPIIINNNNVPCLAMLRFKIPDRVRQIHNIRLTFTLALFNQSLLFQKPISDVTLKHCKQQQSLQFCAATKNICQSLELGFFITRKPSLNLGQTEILFTIFNNSLKWFETSGTSK